MEWKYSFQHQYVQSPGPDAIPNWILKNSRTPSQNQYVLYLTALSERVLFQQFEKEQMSMHNLNLVNNPTKFKTANISHIYTRNIHGKYILSTI